MRPAVPRTALPLALVLFAACGGRTPAAAVMPAATAPGTAAAIATPIPSGPEPQSLGVAPPEVTMGAAAPTLVQAVAPDGRWVVLCQARADTDGDGRLGASIGMHGDPHGDALAPYFVEGGGPGVAIDDFLGADPSGRFVLLLRHGQPVLRDTTTSGETALVADPSPAAFGDGGDELAYVRRQGSAREVVVRTLATGNEVEIDAGAGELVAMALYPRAQALRVVVKLPAPDGGKDELHTNLYRGRCAGRASSSSHWGITRSVYEQRIVSLKHARVRVVPEEVRPFLHGWLRTLADGSTRFESFAEDSASARPTCGELLFADPVRGRLVAACPEGRDVGLRLFGEGAPRLIATFDHALDQQVAPFGRHLLITTRDADDLIVDVETGERRLAPTYQRLIAIRGDTTLVQRGEQLVLLDGGSERVLGAIEPYPRIFGVSHRTTGEAERLVLVDTLAVDLTRGAIVGVVPDQPPLVLGGLRLGPVKYRPFGFTKDGWILVESPPPEAARVVSDVARGPMRWTKLAPASAK